MCIHDPHGQARVYIHEKPGAPQLLRSVSSVTRGNMLILSECSGIGTEICGIQFNLGMRGGFREEVIFDLDLIYGKICGYGS